MATNSKKGKSSKDSDKKSSKRAEESPSVEERAEDTPQLTDAAATPAAESPVVEEPPPQEPSPEPVYEEPVLTQLVVDRYDGEKAKGLYQGDGEAWFAGDNHYKGQFEEGLMHGRGVYTWADGVAYEGEFTLNQVTGKGFYKWTDSSTYEGEVLNGLRHGYGVYRCPDNKMSYSGEWYQGKRQGKGRMDYDNSGLSFYEGDWVDNLRHGWGTRRYISGNIYQGMWFNNLRHGEGTLRWLDRDQMYSGQWENGIQHGMGQHIWFLRRAAGSQYPLRNMYDGDFNHGLRDGCGTFYFANGARYEGQWQNNLKCGKGKFVFKNGRVYEGQFEKDHIVEFPNFEMDGVNTPDLTQIRTRTPLPSEQMSVHSNDSRNTYSPSFQLDVDHLLEEFPESDREEEAAQVIFVIMRHVTSLRKIYTYYCSLGYEDSPDNTFVMNRMQFWRFLKDCHLHYNDLTLVEMDRLLATTKALQEDMHNPYTKVLFREFTNYLVTLAYHLYHEEHQGTSPMLAWCMSKLMSDNVLKHSCSVQGYIYFETRRAVNAMVHIEQAYEVYRSFCMPRKNSPYEPCLKMRQFLHLLQDLRLINSDLTPKTIVEVLAIDDPKVTDEEGSINMELEITFLEFFESLVGCAQLYVTESVVKDPSTPRPSTAYTHDQSVSILGSHSRIHSQSGGDEEGTEAVSQQGGEDDSGSPAQRTTSQLTSKTGDTKAEHQASHTTAAASSSEVHPEASSHHTHIGSAKKSEVSTLPEHKKSGSYTSPHSPTTPTEGQALMQSMVSLPAARDASEPSDECQITGDEAQEEDEEELPPAEEELDEATKQFNFWTHQVHIFFVRKFFPASHRFLFLRQIVKSKMEQDSDTKVL